MNENQEKIIAVTSNKGGTGKTTISLCMALYFSHNKNKKTLLLEMDSSPGDFSVLFNVTEEHSIEVAIKFSEKICMFTKNISRNLDIMRGFSNPLSAEEIETEELNNLLAAAHKEYEIIIIDTQSVLNGSIIDILRATNYIFLISDLEIESLFRNLEYINLLKNKFLLINDNFYFLVNKKRLIDIFKIVDISKIINLPILGFISFEKNFYKSLFSNNQNRFLKSRVFRNTAKILENFCIKNGI